MGLIRKVPGCISWESFSRFFSNKGAPGPFGKKENDKWERKERKRQRWRATTVP